MDKQNLNRCRERLDQMRSEIFRDSPFYGRLLLTLPVSLARCGTACTNMEKVFFDPSFIEDMKHDELKFLYLHELLHCVLQHPARGKGLDRFTYNVACDIVINSFLMELLPSVKTINGEPIDHRTPSGDPGHLYTAEQVYDQLLQNNSGQPLSKSCGVHMVDMHDVWEHLGQTERDIQTEIWRGRARKAMEEYGSPDDRAFLKREVDFDSRRSALDWRQILHDYLLRSTEDYTYLVPDRRYQGDFIMPSFQKLEEGSLLDNVWILIDTSASISRAELSQAYREIISVIEQVGEIKGRISFFENDVTVPCPVETVTDVKDLTPLGRGGTDFHRIFQVMDEFFNRSELPSLIMILTDGYASFPKESITQGVPVLWVMIGSDVKPPWGTCVYVKEESND